jgi:predicted aminopeptidase
MGLPGCASMTWYGQAASGQMDLLSRREDIADLLVKPETDPKLAERLRLALEIRDFAISELGLPDSPSYTQYADLGRPAAVWNVVAAPRFSVEPRTWCYPLVGCLAYRGYFDEHKARSAAVELETQGFDAAVFAVPAYSTLGWFADPVLNTMLGRGDTWLAGLIFHELTHEKLFVKGGTAFSEGYATAVERIGVERWLTTRGDLDELARWRRSQSVQTRFTKLLLETREALAELYGSALNDTRKDARRSQMFDALKARVRELDQEMGDDRFSRWASREINNAHLALVATYEASVDGFFRIYAGCEKDIRCFHSRVADLAEADSDTRRRVLSDTWGSADDPA